MKILRFEKGEIDMTSNDEIKKKMGLQINGFVPKKTGQKKYIEHANNHTRKDYIRQKSTTTCPYCLEEIYRGSIKCKHCNEWLNGKEKAEKKVSQVTIVLGYIFSLLGGWLGLAIALYLVSRKEKRAQKHGGVMLLILFIWLIILIGISSTR